MLKRMLKSEFKNSAIPKIIFAVSVFTAIFFLSLKSPTDPDLFWHLKTGELMWQYKIIPHTNWFSYTMSDYPWIDHEWLSEALMYQMKNLFEWWGLAIFFSLLTAFTFTYLIPKICRKNEKNEDEKYPFSLLKMKPFYTSYALAILGAIVASPMFGIRPQMFTFFGTVFVLYALKEYRLNNKSKSALILPIIFLIWANLHAGFAMGLAILLIFLFIEKALIENEKNSANPNKKKFYQPLKSDAWKKLAHLTILSIATTLINPYGIRIYSEIFNTVSDNYAANIIKEWLPPNFHNIDGILLASYIVFILIIVFAVKKIDVMSFVLVPLLLFLSLRNQRNIPIFVAVSLPLLAENLEDFEKAFEQTLRKKFAIAAIGIMLLVYAPLMNLSSAPVKALSSEKELVKVADYPVGALEFLKSHSEIAEKNIFNDYNWGGYIIGNAECEISNSEPMACNPKTFIDGRMTFWKTPEQNAFKDYVNIRELDNEWEKNMDKYDVKVVFIKTNSYLSQALKFNSAWKKIYSDDKAVIYEKL